MNEVEVVERLLTTPGRWAVVGCSPDPGRDSHRVARYLQELGHDIVPVNPNADGEIHGVEVVPSLADAAEGGSIDVVDIFRRADRAGEAVDEAIVIGAGAVWMQLDVIDAAAAGRADVAGLDVIMDLCPMIEYPRLRR